MSNFISIETTHSAEIAWWWSNEKLHDHAYHCVVDDAVKSKVREACATHHVRHNTSYCCQWEGVELLGADKSAVELAANEVAAVLSRFKDVMSLDDAAAAPAEEEFVRRMADLHTLKDRAGAAHTLCQVATNELQGTAPADVDWVSFERQVISASIGQYGQDPDQVLAALCQHSPGCVSVARQEELKAFIQEVAPALQAGFGSHEKQYGRE